MLAAKLLDMPDRNHDLARELQQWRKISRVEEQPSDLKPLTREILSTGRDPDDAYVLPRRKMATLLARCNAMSLSALANTVGNGFDSVMTRA